LSVGWLSTGGRKLKKEKTTVYRIVLVIVLPERSVAVTVKVCSPTVLVCSPTVLVSRRPAMSTAPMVAWMLFRGMPRRETAEMAAVMPILAIALLALGWLAVVPKSELALLEHPLMMPAILVPMVFRIDLYSGRSGRTGHHGDGRREADRCSRAERRLEAEERAPHAGERRVVVELRVP
jgi:hypothetical protein